MHTTDDFFFFAMFPTYVFLAAGLRKMEVNSKRGEGRVAEQRNERKSI